MWPLRFVMPHDPSMRPAWMIRAGLFLYDHLAKREVLPGSCAVDLRGTPDRRAAEEALHQGLRLFRRLGGRRAAGGAERHGRAERGATVLTRCACVDAAPRRHAGLAGDAAPDDGSLRTVSARALVNAAGPWAAQFLGPSTRTCRSASRCAWSRAATSWCASC
jgi:glycerol-3-phosphate dehydrogenase